jgi:hypothetical protein
VKHESTFYLLIAAFQLSTILFVAISWGGENIPNTLGVVVLKCCFFVLALTVLAWSGRYWAIYKKIENDERTNKKS